MYSRRRLQTALLFLAASILSGDSGAPASAQIANHSPDTASAGAPQQLKGVAALLSQIVASGRLADLRWPAFPDYRQHVTDFYRPSGYQLAWVLDGKPTPQAVELTHILQDADREGLRAEDYDASLWPDRVISLKGPHEPAREARFDAALTVCVMRYVSDLHSGRINPHRVGFEFDVADRKLDLPDFVRQRLVNGSDLRSELAGVAPPFPAYQRLRTALQHYMELAKHEDKDKVLDAGPVSPGGYYAGVAGLARRLRLLGDLPDNAMIPPDSRTYEGSLVDAVKHFQGRFGLRPTGEFDYKTIVEMNVPLGDRIEQMRLGLERYRWLPSSFQAPRIVVNVPEFRLYGFDEGDRLDLTMRVSVGEDYSFKTPMFEDRIRYIVFHPYWVPPPNILHQEIMPLLQKHPSLEELGLELIDASGKVIRSGRVTPEILQQVQAGKLTVRQPPGPDNGMGLVKFMFPNKYNVYIHDTPESQKQNAFSDEDRGISHGCIRAREPDKLAAFLLRTTPGWDLERVEHAMHEGPDNVTVDLAPATPVWILYETTVVDENGDVHFFHDIYAHDRRLKMELAHGYPYPH